MSISKWSQPAGNAHHLLGRILEVFFLIQRPKQYLNLYPEPKNKKKNIVASFKNSTRLRLCVRLELPSEVNLVCYYSCDVVLTQNKVTKRNKNSTFQATPSLLGFIDIGRVTLKLIVEVVG